MAYESWLLSFTIDLRPYLEHIEQLDVQIDQFMASVLELTRDFEQASGNDTQLKSLHADITRLTVQEVSLCKVEINELRDAYFQLRDTFSYRQLGTNSRDRTGYRKIGTKGQRSKRSFLPWVGKILSGLTGTVTEEELKVVKEHISILADQNQGISQVVEDSLTIINVTRADVRENRETLNHLGDVVQSLANKLRSLYEDVIVAMQREILYDQYLNRAHTVFHIIGSELRQTSISFIKIKRQLENAMQGHLAFDLLPRQDLRTLLGQIEKALPHNYLLPYGIDNLKQYYSEVPTILMNGDQAVHVILAVPIAPLESMLTIYEPVYVPSLNNDSSKAYQYILEAEALAVTPDHYGFRLLTRVEAEVCSQGGVKFCKLNKATFRTAQVKTCITALFFKDQAQIDNNCPVVTTVVPKRPVIKHLFEGNWLMFSPKNERLQVSCSAVGERRSELPRISVNRGVNTISLPMSCSARSDSYMLPAYYKNETTYEVKHAFYLETIAMNQVNLFANVSQTMPNYDKANSIPRLIPELPEIADYSEQVGSLKEKLMNKVKMLMGDYERKHNSGLLLTGVACALVLIVIITVTCSCFIRLNNKFREAAHLLGQRFQGALELTPLRKNAGKTVNTPSNQSDFSDDEFEEASIDIPIPHADGQFESCGPQYVNIPPDPSSETNRETSRANSPSRRSAPVVKSATPTTPRSQKRKPVVGGSPIPIKLARPSNAPRCSDDLAV